MIKGRYGYEEGKRLLLREGPLFIRRIPYRKNREDITAPNAMTRYIAFGGSIFTDHIAMEHKKKADVLLEQIGDIPSASELVSMDRDNTI